MERFPLLDTNVLLGLVGDPRKLLGHVAQINRGRTWLSAIVACELRAGSRSVEEGRVIEDLITVARRRGRFLAPNEDDWTVAGRLLERRIRLAGALRPRDHLADLLIVVTAARVRAVVVTRNLVHFRAWAELIDVPVMAPTD